MFQRLKKALNPRIEVVEVDAHINDPVFAERSVEVMLDVMRDKRPVRRKNLGYRKERLSEQKGLVE